MIGWDYDAGVCEECRRRGDDYYYKDDEELVCACDRCEENIDDNLIYL